VSGAPSLDHGSSAGAAFQRLCKISPAFAVEAAAVGLRAIGGKAPHGHWGPISRKEAEIRPEADALLAQVQQMVEAPIVVPPFPIPLPQPGPAPVPSPPPVIGDFVTAVLTQLISLLKERLMSLQSIGTQPATTAAPTSAQQVEELRKLVEIFGSLITDGKLGPPPLGQVNGALGQTIGNLLNGKKTAIGVIGALATSLLGNVPWASGGVGQIIATAIPAAAGLSGYALPLFLAMTAWGVLGKMEKWSQVAAQTPQGAKQVGLRKGPWGATRCAYCVRHVN